MDTDKGRREFRELTRIQLAIIGAIRVKHCAPLFPICENPRPSVVKNLPGWERGHEMARQGGIFRLLILGNWIDRDNRNADQTNGRNDLAIGTNSKQKNGVAANEVYRRVAAESDLILLFTSAGRSKPENDE
jgi:hypothetical protein